MFWSSFKSVSFRALFRPISPRLYPNLYSIWSVWCKNESILHAGVLQGPLVLSVLKQIYTSFSCFDDHSCSHHTTKTQALRRKVRHHCRVNILQRRRPIHCSIFSNAASRFDVRKPKHFHTAVASEPQPHAQRCYLSDGTIVRTLQFPSFRFLQRP